MEKQLSKLHTSNTSLIRITKPHMLLLTTDFLYIYNSLHVNINNAWVQQFYFYFWEFE